MTEVTVIVNKEARLDNSKRKDELEGEKHPHSESKRDLLSKMKTQIGLSDCA